MCYTLFLSTTSAEDLAAGASALVRFRKESLETGVAARLAYPHQWYVGSASGCSCTFRHAMDASLGFGAPADWYPEKPEALEATAEFEAIVRRLLEEGHQVDCVDAWWGAAPEEIVDQTVDLGLLAPGEFRFFENYHFTFRASGGELQSMAGPK